MVKRQSIRKLQQASVSLFVLTVLKLWKRLMLCGGGGVSMGNCKKDFMSR